MSDLKTKENKLLIGLLTKKNSLNSLSSNQLLKPEKTKSKINPFVSVRKSVSGNPFDCLKNKQNERCSEQFVIKSTPQLFQKTKSKRSHSDDQIGLKKLKQDDNTTVREEENDFDSDNDKENIDPNTAIVPLKQRAELTTLDHIPVEWSIKTKVTITSKETFEWCCNTTSKSDSLSLLEFVSSDENNENLAAQMHQIRYSWVYEVKMPPSHSSIVAKALGKLKSKNNLILHEHEKSELNYFKEKEEQWKQSFQSAYMMVRNGSSDYLVYINSMFTIVFLSEKDASGKVLTKASLNRSSLGFRLILKDQDIEFEPYSKISKPKPSVIDLENAEDDMLKDDIFLKRSGTDDGLGTVGLKFTSKVSVHGLYDFILNWSDPRLEIRTASLPILMSHKPFLGAQIHQCKLIRSVVQSNDAVKLYQVSITGYLLPSQCKALLELVRKQHQVGKTAYNCTFETLDLSNGILFKDGIVHSMKRFAFTDGIMTVGY
ncbi:hypothetical protein BC833DRAFT_601692 [Globomyces pollinis-pini]|nr:hypothetical protein BC833DRAFT_601692 [Globomyces pollinis-pini]